MIAAADLTDVRRADIRDRVKKLRRMDWGKLRIAEDVHVSQATVTQILAGEWDHYRRSPGSDESWRFRGACRDADPEVFYPERGGNNGGDEARRICSGCPVRSRCLEYALGRPNIPGIWGGTSAIERRALRRRRVAA